MATTDIYTVQGDITNTKHAARFLGGNVDDGIQVDALAAALVAGNHTKGTITAWIMCPDETGTYCIFGAGDANVAEYVYLALVAGKITFKVQDGGATRVQVTTTNKVIKRNLWHHVALVQDGTKPKIYINGEEVAVTIDTGTELGQWFDDTDGIDGAHIGAADSIGGDAALTLEYKGYISDVRIWSGTASTAALSAAQVKADYLGDRNNTTSLLAWYDMDCQVVNQANPGTYDGTVVGDLICVDANEFACKLSYQTGTPVVADKISLSINNGVGFAVVIQAA